MFLGAAIGAIGSIFGGASKRKAARAQAKASRLNAQQVRERTEIEATLRERRGEREAGSINSAAGASGLSGGGSASDILRESARNTAFDLNTIRTQGALQAEVHELEAKGAKSAGNRALLGGALGAASILIGR